jgi:predicted nucleic acid-binding protein
MNVVDSSGWLEYFADGPNVDFFAPAIQDTDQLVVPTISIYEVFKRVLQQRGEGEALQAVAVIAQGQVVGLDTTLALHAAKLSVDRKLPMADSIMLATAQAHGATLWTQDADFENTAGVKYIGKKV